MTSEGVPTFSAARVAKLFGYSTPNPISRWFDAGLLEMKRSAGRRSSSVAPAALLAFVRTHPNAYDWRNITDPRLKEEARKVNERDPLVPVDELIKESPATLPELAGLAKRGVFTLVRRRSGGAGGGKVSYWVRKSAIRTATAAIEEARRREDPIYALHSLLDHEQPAPAEPVARVVSVAAMPARKCPKCGSRLVRVWAGADATEAIEAIEKCLACGEEVAVNSSAGDSGEHARTVPDGGLRPRMTPPPRLPGSRVTA